MKVRITQTINKKFVVGDEFDLAIHESGSQSGGIAILTPLACLHEPDDEKHLRTAHIEKFEVIILGNTINLIGHLLMGQWVWFTVNIVMEVIGLSDE